MITDRVGSYTNNFLQSQKSSNPSLLLFDPRASSMWNLSVIRNSTKAEFFLWLSAFWFSTLSSCALDVLFIYMAGPLLQSLIILVPDSSILYSLNQISFKLVRSRFYLQLTEFNLNYVNITQNNNE